LSWFEKSIVLSNTRSQRPRRETHCAELVQKIRRKNQRSIYPWSLTIVNSHPVKESIAHGPASVPLQSAPMFSANGVPQTPM